MNARDLSRTIVPLALLALASCSGRQAAGEADDQAAPVARVRVAAISDRVFRETIEAPGQWRASNQLVITAPFPAYVDSLRAEVGDLVTRGSVLGALETQESRAALTGAEQLLAAAQDPQALSEAQHALRQAHRDIVRVPLLASGDGTVVRRSVSPGEQVAAGGELLVLVAARSLVFEAHVPQHQAARVSVGQAARIEMEDGHASTARVLRRLPQTSVNDQSALVWLATPEPPQVGLLDRFGTAAIVVGDARHALAVPDSALVEDDLTGQFRIACVGPGNVVAWTAVQLGSGADGWHALLAPSPAAGTRVIVSGQRGLPDSTRVTFQP